VIIIPINPVGDIANEASNSNEYFFMATSQTRDLKIVDSGSTKLIKLVEF
jgi:hypothetical protein